MALKAGGRTGRWRSSPASRSGSARSATSRSPAPWTCAKGRAAGAAECRRGTTVHSSPPVAASSRVRAPSPGTKRSSGCSKRATMRRAPAPGGGVGALARLQLRDRLAQRAGGEAAQSPPHQAAPRPSGASTKRRKSGTGIQAPSGTPPAARARSPSGAHPGIEDQRLRHGRRRCRHPRPAAGPGRCRPRLPAAARCAGWRRAAASSSRASSETRVASAWRRSPAASCARPRGEHLADAAEAPVAEPVAAEEDRMARRRDAVVGVGEGAAGAGCRHAAWPRRAPSRSSRGRRPSRARGACRRRRGGAACGR